MSSRWRVTCGLAILIPAGVVAPATGVAQTSTKPASPSHLTGVVIERQSDAIAVYLKTQEPPRYTAIAVGAPVRILIDMEGAGYAWSRGPLTVNPPPVREIQARQWRPGTARVGVELTRRVGYSSEERSACLLLRLDSGAIGSEEEPLVPSVEQPPTGADDLAVALEQPVAQAPTPMRSEAAAPARAAGKGLSLGGQFEVGYRAFLLHRGRGLDDDNVDIEADLEFSYQLTEALLLRLHPRLAIDPLESSRNRYEPFDAYLEYTAGSWALVFGQLIESWAIVDTFSPADLLNRRDFGRNFYDPQKLGELMVRVRLFLPEARWIRQPTLSLYALPLFRDTPLPSNRDRFRFDVNADNIGDLSNHVIEPSFKSAFAARLAATVGSADVSLFYFGGPGRFPSFDVSGPARMTPVYYRVDAVGAGVERALGSWLLKAETVYTFTSASGLPRRFSGAVPPSYLQYVVGIGRTVTNVLGKNELTLTLEFSGEDKPNVTTLAGLRPFKSDVFLGMRWRFHDQRRTEINAFLAADVLKREQLWLVDFKTVLYKDLQLVLSSQFANRGPSRPPDKLSVFGLFPNNANVRIALRYEF